MRFPIMCESSLSLRVRRRSLHVVLGCLPCSALETEADQLLTVDHGPETN